MKASVEYCLTIEEIDHVYPLWVAGSKTYSALTPIEPRFLDLPRTNKYYNGKLRKSPKRHKLSAFSILSWGTRTARSVTCGVRELDPLSGSDGHYPPLSELSFHRSWTCQLPCTTNRILKRPTCMSVCPSRVSDFGSLLFVGWFIRKSYPKKKLSWTNLEIAESIGHCRSA